MKYDGAIITFNKWSSYNPRKEAKKPNWFRFDNDFFYNATFSDFSAEERLVVIYLWCLASKHNGDPFVVKYSHAKQHAALQFMTLDNAIEKLVKEQCITFARTRSHEVVRDLHDVAATEYTEYTENTENTRASEKTINSSLACKNQQTYDTRQNNVPDEVKQEWEATKRHYGQTANWHSDEIVLFRAYQRIRDWSRIKNALAGFRFEEKNKSYDPAKHLNLARLLDTDKFKRLEDLGDAGIRGAFEPKKTDYSYLENMR